MTTLFPAKQSDDIAQELMRAEGFSSHCYLCPSGQHTIGYGRNIDKSSGLGITESEALHLLEGDLARCINEARRFGWFDDLRPAHQNVIVELLYVLGFPSFSGFNRMLSALSRGDMDTAADELLDSRFARQVPARAERLACQLRG